MLIGSYPQQKVNDARAYALAVTIAFGRFPEWIGRRAIEDLILSKYRYPTAADVFKACDEIQGRENQRERRARDIVAEHERRAAEAQRRAVVARDREKVLAKFEKHGSPSARLAEEWGMPVPGDANE